ncbi:Vesicle-associated membrane protein [Cardamine amara subsp. amara]|uniref:Vesicle-associated membrane protein n=1 Tax=Cardamine amara subsp. amara TaxID=228776 RepID=A0ABD1BTF0_CARAN
MSTITVTKRYGGGKATTAQANSLNREFGSKLKEHVQYCVDHPEEISKLAKVKAQVTEVKGVMMENIEKAQDFRTQGTKIRRKMWFENMKIKLIVLRYRHCLDSHHRTLGLSWLQVYLKLERLRSIGCKIISSILVLLN